MRSWERVDSRTYPDSVYAEEHETDIHQINLRNEVRNQISVDACGAQLDDFN